MSPTIRYGVVYRLVEVTRVQRQRSGFDLRPMTYRCCFQETYGEDPFLIGELGAAYVHGIQVRTPCQPYPHVNPNPMSTPTPCQPYPHVNPIPMSTLSPYQPQPHVNPISMSSPTPCQPYPDPHFRSWSFAKTPHYPKYSFICPTYINPNKQTKP